MNGASSNERTRRRNAWWLHPRNVVIFLVIPLLIGAYLVPENTYYALYGSQKHVDLNFVLIALIVYAGFIVGSSFAVSLGTRPQWDEIIAYCRWIVWPLWAATLFGYTVWYSSALIAAGGPGTLLDAVYVLIFDPELENAEYLKRELFDTIPGITTLTQCGILYATVETWLWLTRSSPPRRCLMRFGLFATFVIPRPILLAERQAIIEVAIPIIVILAAWLYSRGLHRNLIRFAPLVLGVGVFGLFALGEYFRSWNYYRLRYNGAYFEFAIDRFLGYYTTAINNAAVTYYYEPLQPLRYTLTSLLNFPVVSEVSGDLYEALAGEGYIETLALLDIYANPEFNNVALVGLLLNEFSVFLAPIAAFLLGLLATSLYNGFLKGRLIGALLYPSWFVGLLDISRIYYWSNQRYFPVLAFLVVSLIAFRIFKMPAKRNDPPAPGTQRQRHREHA